MFACWRVAQNMLPTTSGTKKNLKLVQDVGCSTLTDMVKFVSSLALHVPQSKLPILVGQKAEIGLGHHTLLAPP